MKNFIRTTLAASAVYAASTAQATTNLVYSPGASAVFASSAEAGANIAVMAADLLTANKTAWASDGDTRYTFGANDPNATIEISLGQLRSVNDIGASAIPSFFRGLKMQLLIGVSMRLFSYRESVNASSASQSPKKAAHEANGGISRPLFTPTEGQKVSKSRHFQNEGIPELDFAHF